MASASGGAKKTRMALTVPAPHLPILEWLSGIDQAQAEAIRQRLEKVTPQGDPSELTPVLQDIPSIPVENASALVNTLVSMYLARYRERLSASEFAEEVTTDIGRSWTRSSEALRSLRERLTGLLLLDATVGITAKAFALRVDGLRSLCESPKIITDIRPVFVEQQEPVPAAAMILHSLHLRYHDGDSVQDLSLSVDHADLHELAYLIDRALRKERVLRDSLQHTVLRSLDAGEVAG